MKPRNDQPWTHDHDEILRREFLAGSPDSYIGKLLARSVSSVKERRRALCMFHYRGSTNPNYGFDPTPEQIARACERIQQTWNATEENKRRIIKQRGWVTPLQGSAR